MPSEAIRRHQKLDGRRDRTIRMTSRHLPIRCNHRFNQKQSDARDRTIRMTSRHLPEQVEQEGGIVRRLERVDIEVGQPALNTARTRGTPTLVSGRVEGEEKRAEAIRQQSEHTASTK